jgi:hypothetical protein
MNQLFCDVGVFSPSEDPPRADLQHDVGPLLLPFLQEKKSCLSCQTPCAPETRTAVCAPRVCTAHNNQRAASYTPDAPSVDEVLMQKRLKGAEQKGKTSSAESCRRLMPPPSKHPACKGLEAKHASTEANLIKHIGDNPPALLNRQANVSVWLTLWS